MCFDKTLFRITGHGPDLSQGQNLPVLSLGHFSLMLFKALPYTELKQSFCRQTRYHLHLTEEKIEAQRVANPHIIDRGRTPRQVWHLHHITESPTLVPPIPNSKYLSRSAGRRASATPTSTQGNNPETLPSCRVHIVFHLSMCRVQPG